MMNFGNKKISGCVYVFVNFSLSVLYVSAVLGTRSSIVSYVISNHATVCMDENMQLLNWNNTVHKNVSLVKQKTATINEPNRYSYFIFLLHCNQPSSILMIILTNVLLILLIK